MSETPFEQEYLQHVEERIGWHKRTADRTMIQFMTLRLGLVLVSAALPALTVLDNRLWAIVASIIVAGLTGLDTQFHWGEEWRHFRSTQMALERTRREYERRTSAFATDAEVDIPAAEKFAMFYSEVENLLQAETDRFFKFKITPWKSRSA